jgi:hypothetical protein
MSQLEVPSTLKGLVYVQGNIPAPNANVILAYRRDAEGNLTPLPGSPFPTGGAGVSSVIERAQLPHFGPLDFDQPLIVNPERTRLFAVNPGSDTIAVFDIHPDGGLVPVEGSPFPSGGIEPVSLGLVGDKLFVVNKNEDPARDMTKTRPNYTGFKVAANGALAPILDSTFELPSATRSPTQALIVEDKFLFDGDFGGFPMAPRLAMWGDMLKADSPSVLRSFRIGADGKLVPNTPLPAPEGEFDGGIDIDEDGNPDPLMFGLQAHPKEKLLYVGFVTNARMGIFSYDDLGQLTFVRTVPNKGVLICWVLVNQAGTRAYTTNNGDTSLSVYDLTEPTNPIEIQWLKLRGEGHPYQLALDSEGEFLYVVKHRTFPETPVGEGGVLNILKVHHDGTATEVVSSPFKLPVPAEPFARPMGVVAL